MEGTRHGGIRLYGGCRKRICLTNILRHVKSALRRETFKAEGATRVADKILEAVRQPMELGGHEVSITTSVGIALYPDGGKDPDTLLKNADTAMYHAKETGRNNYQVYTPS
ncbi:MAG: GGDEF domain-containing protein [Candidatus Brocadiales bacterium]